MIMIGDFFVHLFRKHTQNTRAFALFKCFHLKNITRRCIQISCVEHFTIVGEWHCIVHKLNAYGFVVRPLAVWSANAQGISVAYAQRINVGHWTNRWFWRYVLWLNVLLYVIRCMEENCRIELNINLRVIRFIADNSITILILCLFCVCDERWRMNDRREANRQMTQHSIYSSCVMVNALWQLCIATSPLLNTQSPEVNILRLFGEETAVVNRHSIWSRKFQRRLRVALL